MYIVKSIMSLITIHYNNIHRDRTDKRADTIGICGTVVHIYTYRNLKQFLTSKYLKAIIIY